MKVRIKEDFQTPKGALKAGDIVDVKPATAARWNEEGKAIYLKIITPREKKGITR